MQKSIGRALQKARRAAGYKSARAFAEKVNIPLSAYTEYEQGRVGLSLERAWEFADALGCTLDELAGRKPPSSTFSDEERQIAIAYKNMDARDKRAMRALAASLSGNSAEMEGVA